MIFLRSRSTPDKHVPFHRINPMHLTGVHGIRNEPEYILYSFPLQSAYSFKCITRFYVYIDERDKIGKLAHHCYIYTLRNLFNAIINYNLSLLLTLSHTLAPDKCMQKRETTFIHLSVVCRECGFVQNRFNSSQSGQECPFAS